MQLSLAGTGEGQGYTENERRWPRKGGGLAHSSAMETACALSGSAKSSREIRCPRAENPGVGLSGRVSDLSGVVTILPSAPPPSPSDLRAAMRAQQAHIIMHSEATAIMHATTSADATGLVLHCSEAGSSTWPAPSRWWTGSSACLSGSSCSTRAVTPRMQRRSNKPSSRAAIAPRPASLFAQDLDPHHQCPAKGCKTYGTVLPQKRSLSAQCTLFIQRARARSAS